MSEMSASTLISGEGNGTPLQYSCLETSGPSLEYCDSKHNPDYNLTQKTPSVRKALSITALEFLHSLFPECRKVCGISLIHILR